jgi:hypothetical protein
MVFSGCLRFAGEAATAFFRVPELEQNKERKGSFGPAVGG